MKKQLVLLFITVIFVFCPREYDCVISESCTFTPHPASQGRKTIRGKITISIIKNNLSKGACLKLEGAPARRHPPVVYDGMSQSRVWWRPPLSANSHRLGKDVLEEIRTTGGGGWAEGCARRRQKWKGRGDGGR